MNEDTISKTIEILLQNQTQFYAILQMIQETNKDAEKRIGVLESDRQSLQRSCEN